MDTTRGMIRVEVVSALSERTWSAELRLPEGATVAEALADPAGRAVFPAAATLPVGIHSRQCMPDQALRDGDRIELYRPLIIDAKNARRERAQSARIRR